MRDRFDLINPPNKVSNLSGFDRFTFEATSFLHTCRIDVN
jgi:hypothetical protein